MNDVEDELSEDEEIIDHRDSVLIRKAATRRYQENLMKDINVAFNRKSKLPDISVSCFIYCSEKRLFDVDKSLCKSCFP